MKASLSRHSPYLRNKKVHIRVYKSLLLDTVLSETNPVHMVTMLIVGFLLILSSYLCSGLRIGQFSSVFQRYFVRISCILIRARLIKYKLHCTGTCCRTIKHLSTSFLPRNWWALPSIVRSLRLLCTKACNNTVSCIVRQDCRTMDYKTHVLPRSLPAPRNVPSQVIYMLNGNIALRTTRFPLNRRLNRLQTWSGCSAEEKFLPHTGNRTLVVQSMIC